MTKNEHIKFRIVIHFNLDKKAKTHILTLEAESQAQAQRKFANVRKQYEQKYGVVLVSSFERVGN